MLTRNRIVAAVTALVAALVGLYFGPLDERMGDQRPAPFVAESATKANLVATHAGMKAEPFDLKGVERSAIPEHLPLATPSQRGCTTKLVGNFSSRGGVRPELFPWHYTVSRNIDGWADMNGVWGWFNNPRSQASSNYLIDAEGHCYLMVAEANKAWTQGSFNPASISIEFIAVGNESREWWKTEMLPGLKKGALVTADALKRWDIPLRFVNPEGCTVIAGITDHDKLECGNTHTDVTPNFPYTKMMSLVKAAYFTCYRFDVRDNGNTIASSRRYRAGSGKADERLVSLRQEMLGRLNRDDHDVGVKRVKVACG